MIDSPEPRKDVSWGDGEAARQCEVGWLGLCHYTGGIGSVGPGSSVFTANCWAHPTDVGELSGCFDVDITAEAR